MVARPELAEKCGVFGVFGSPEAAKLTYYGLWSLQHRGQESSGIVSSDGRWLYDHIGPGLVAQVYTDENLDALAGHLAIGHNRYSTSGGGSRKHSQPVLRPSRRVALAHNGNLPSTLKLEEFLSDRDRLVPNSNDSEMMADAIEWYLDQGRDLEAAVIAAFPLFTGAFSMVIMDKSTMVAVRDECGMRPLSLGQLVDGFVVASETCAFDTVGAAHLRDIEPGELVAIDAAGLRSYQLVKPRPRLDVFEYVYFARPDSVLMGRNVNEVRRRLGRNLAHEHQIQADVVVPIPDSAIPAALGFAEASGLPFDHGLVKNRYIHRTFIRPAQQLREHDISMKLNPVPATLMGKDVVLIDDSIVRGTTTRKIVNLVQGAGARRVHVLISSPPVKYPDFYGIDTPRQEDLIAAAHTIREVRDHIGADSLGYLSYRGMVAATGWPAGRLSTACFNGVYPIDIAERATEVLGLTPQLA